MGFFSSKPTQQLPWKNINSIEELNALKNNAKPYLLFKHSTRCGVSRMVLSSFEKDWDVANDSVDLFFVDLLAHRDVSNQIEKNYGVAHQSPQAIKVENDVVTYSASHSAISAHEIQKS